MQVQSIQSAKKKRGEYIKKYSNTDKAVVAKYACENGIAANIRHYASKQMNLKESTVRDWRRVYLSELAKKKQSADIGEELVVLELLKKPIGRPPLLGVKLDNDLKTLIKAMRKAGTTINSAIVIGVGRGLLLKSKRELLDEYGGPIILTKEWAKSVLRRMGFTKRRANSKSKVTVEDFIQLKIQFLLDIKACIEFEDIPYDMVVNWDQTGLKIVPSSNWTMEQMGTK